ncbi:MAG TPA: pitrilysin family protein [Gemmatimonas sp.]|nr:pitrilysin family protein [Gemmatimonas sp.]
MTRQPRAEGLALHDDTLREVLPNGLTLLIRRDTSAPVVAIVTYVKAGYFDETDDLVGIAHVLEHMFFKGTPSRGVGQIARETKANGGYLNAHTIYDHTSYYTVLPSAAFVQGLEIQFDAYAHSIIDPGELARELEVIIQEVKRKRDTPTAVAIESLYALLFDAHRIRRWRMGEEDALRELTSEKLHAFYRHWYRPSNTILSIVGDVDPDIVRREVLARHGALADTPAPRDAGPVESAPAGFRLRDWSGDVVQQQLAFGWRTPASGHPDAVALDLAGVALGTGRASRLYRAVRERQLASSVSAWNYTAGDIGVFVLHAESPAEHAVQAAAQTWRETQAARLHGFRPTEVVRAQRITEARWLRRLETMDGQANYLASWEAEGGLAAGATYYDRLMSLDARALKGVLERHLDPSQAAVVSYHGAGTAPLAIDAAAGRAMLAEVESLGSSVLPPPSMPTPADIPAIADPEQEPADNPVHNLVPDGAHDPIPSSPHDARVQIQADVQHGVHTYRTAGGVPILILPRAGAPIVHIGIFQRGGSCAEPPEREGLARLTAQAMLKGTATRSGARIAELAEELGASIAVNAGLESLGWSLSVPKRHLGVAAALLADVVQHPAFGADGVETERALALAEVARARDDMYRWPMRLATSAAYGTHPYARAVIGTDTSLALLDTQDVRAFHAAHILTGNTVLAVVGDVQPDAVAHSLAGHFAELAWHGDELVPNVVWPPAMLPVAEARDKQQTALAMLFPGPSRRDDARYAARVLSAVASGLGGRFFEQLRDRQSLAYTVSAFPIERHVSGAFAAYIATSPEREDEARAGLLAEFARLRAEPPSDDEMERARRYLIGTHAIALQSGASVLGDMVDAWLFGSGLHELLETETMVARVTADDVLSLARRYYVEGNVVEGVVRGVMPAGATRAPTDSAAALLSV